MHKVYAFSDIHGMYNLWHQISEYCDETDKIYFLGDAVDRGPDGIKIVKELLTDKRVIYLKGNHEDALVRTGLEILEGHTSSVPLLCQNGGAPTIVAFLKESKQTALDIINKLKTLPTVTEYINKEGKKLILSHAGRPLTELEKYRMWGNDIDYLWDRDHLTWDYENEMTEKMPIIVHGHTPIAALPHYGICPKHYTQIYKYCAGHKIDIDLGCFSTGVATLLDLDTLEPIYFVA
jgi:serine/threonine protein phosphatase 1